MRTILCTCALFFCATAFAQSPENLLDSIRQNYTQEKIFIHYDKSTYLSGETIWFKAYLAEGFFPSAESTVLNVELINDSGKVIQKKILPVFASFAAGNFDIPATARTGSYTVKAYTRRMLNFGTENFYYYSLNIYEPGALQPGSLLSSAPQIYFLPEGGHLVANLRNTVGFICHDDMGYPLAAQGQIRDAAGHDVVTFKTGHDGMGRFEFVPLQGEKYTAEYSAGAGQQSISLPDVSYSGPVLSVKRNGEALFFEIAQSDPGNNSFVPAYILGVEENAVAFKTAIPAGAKLTRGQIPTDLASGILQLTVFNSADQPLAERLVFINNGDYALEGKLLIQRKDLASRAENTFSFITSDTSVTTYSVAVTDADNAFGDSTGTDDIISRFLLSSQLKGRIINPAYYFESTDAEHVDNLDLVMLTHGWRRYSWNEIFTHVFPSMSFKDMNYLSVSGTAYDPVMSQPLSNSELSLFIKTKSNETDFLVLKTDAEGKFITPPMWFEDSAKFSFQKNTGKRGKVNVVLNTPPLGNSTYVVQGRLWRTKAESVTDDMAAKINAVPLSLRSSTDGILLDEVRLKAKAKSAAERYEKKYVSGMLGNGAEHTLDFLADPPHADGSNILEYLKSKIPGVDISGGPFNYTLNYRHMMSLQGGLIPMAIFVDEIQTQADMASSIPVSQVALVKVFSVSQMSGSGGALAIYTKKGADAVVGAGYSDLSILKVEGFSPVKEYFSPNYGVNDSKDILRDERTTLYWNPYLSTDAQHPEIRISFFNSDRAKKMKLIMNGMTTDGKLLHIEKIIE